MKYIVNKLTGVFLVLCLLIACDKAETQKGKTSLKADGHKAGEVEEIEEEHDHAEGDDHDHETDSEEEEVHLSKAQVLRLGIKMDTLSKRNLKGGIEVNGYMGVPPQNEAIITSVIGANIQAILAVEGDRVRKGQIVGYVSHPDLITIQTAYLEQRNRCGVLKQHYERQKRLFEAEVGSGKDFQQAEAEYQSAKSRLLGYESQLKLLGLWSAALGEGRVAQKAPLRSPIDGYVEKVLVKSGQYIQPQTPLFEVVNTDHIHLDLMVFEKDVAKVKNGQEVRFKVEAFGSEEMSAKIYAVGKSFEEGPKALHVHAEILNKKETLIPGMYVKAEIITEGETSLSLPEEAIYQEGDHYYMFVGSENSEGEWEFIPKEILVKFVHNGYAAIEVKDGVDQQDLIAQSGAYFLMAEMKKSEAEHSH